MTEWKLLQVPFRYQLSDWTLMSARMPLLCRSVGLGEDVPTAQSPSPPREEPETETEGFLLRALPVAAGQPVIESRKGYLRYIPLEYPHSFIDLKIGYDEYLKKFSSKTRSTIRRKVKKFQKHCDGQLAWKSYASPDEMADFLQLARAVSKLTYQEQLLDAGIPAEVSFLDKLRQLAAENRVRAHILFDGEKPVSYLCCLAQDGVLSYDYQGYDPAYARLSVGTVLFWLMLEQLFGEDRFDKFDFTEGMSAHKQLFSTHQRQCANVFFIRDTLKNRAIVHSHRTMDRFSRWLGSTLERLGIKARIKRLLRTSG